MLRDGGSIRKELTAQCGCDPRCNLAFDRERSFRRALICIRPDVISGCNINQLRSYSPPAVVNSNAALDNSAGVQRLTNNAYVGRFASVGERRRPGDYA